MTCCRCGDRHFLSAHGSTRPASVRGAACFAKIAWFRIFCMPARIAREAGTGAEAEPHAVLGYVRACRLVQQLQRHDTGASARWARAIRAPGPPQREGARRSACTRQLPVSRRQKNDTIDAFT